MISTKQQNTILKVLSKYEPTQVGIFGSYARNEQNSESDIDIMVDFGKKISLFDLVGIEQELSEKLQIKVDLVTKKSISPLIKKYIERDLKLIA